MKCTVSGSESFKGWYELPESCSHQMKFNGRETMRYSLSDENGSNEVSQNRQIISMDTWVEIGNYSISSCISPLLKR